MNISSDFFNPVKSLVNKINYKYYQLRLKTLQNPYKILGRNTPYKVIMILSHMRAGSSLFTHILISNPEIIGYGETHLTYESEANIKDLLFKVYWQLKEPRMSHKYVLDKLVHNHLIVNPDWLASPQITTIFLIRTPQESLESLLILKPHLSQQEAQQYYCYRLFELEKYAKIINSKERSLLLTYEQILNQTDLVFERLQKVLEIKSPFQEDYKLLTTTGKIGIGDTSANIMAGKIIRKTKQFNLNISSDLVAQAEPVFQHCSKTLSEHCQTINYNPIQKSRVKSQKSRVKSQESRVKSQESRVNSQ